MPTNRAKVLVGDLVGGMAAGTIPREETNLVTGPCSWILHTFRLDNLLTITLLSSLGLSHLRPFLSHHIVRTLDRASSADACCSSGQSH